MPLTVEEARQQPVLLQVQHERVAVDVVAGVLVVEPRDRAAFERGVLVLAVPVGDHRVAVRVERREQHEHDLAQDRQRTRVACGGQAVEQLVGRLRRRHFRPVDAAADGHHHRLVVGDLPRFRLRQPARVREPPVGRLDRVQASEVLRGRHDHGDHAASLGRLPHLDEADAVGRGGDQVDVPEDRRPVGQAPVAPHAEAEELLGGRRLRGGRRRDGGREQDDDQQAAERCDVVRTLVRHGRLG